MFHCFFLGLCQGPSIYLTFFFLLFYGQLEQKYPQDGSFFSCYLEVWSELGKPFISQNVTSGCLAKIGDPFVYQNVKSSLLAEIM